MGEVWLAYDQELYDRPVAIKMMHAHMLADQKDVRRFQREMRLASRMQHPNVMTVFTTGSDNHVPFMVMEYAHGLGVVHRDITPGNLLIPIVALSLLASVFTREK